MTSTSTHGHNSGGQYDQSLLAEAPKATKQMRQEGYNPDILKKNENANRDLERGLGTGASKERLAGTSTPRPSLTPTPTPRSPPFYRTKKGVIVIVIATLVVLGAVIGGAVGGTRNRHREDEAKGAAPGIGKAGGDSGDNGIGAGSPGGPPGGGGGIAPNSTSVQDPAGAITSLLESHSPSKTTTSRIGVPTRGDNGIASVPGSIVKLVGAPPL
ncbi:hypothetical protein E1B28_003409 [Marasmius oreades]|uniref:Uncharacterized protein n=1 Tax=Marasmius oreades TaxID=181124 RepID=A0A9P7UME3_9AGAR|nr:uncharacterized protein E1B28_003409 [Marasmius oreades]KAG7085876.1 hypothetical protein E1B28_003409 [Marasmius oreades]